MLICLATWKEGSTRFLVGQLEHSLAISPEDTFRCFVYDELEDDSGYQVAQSSDATCIGLFLSTEGFRTMRLSRVSSAPTLCEFPKWLTATSTWWSLDSKTAYIFDLTTNATMNATDIRRLRLSTTYLHAVCTERVQTAEKTATIVVHATIGCRNGYMCLKFYGRRNNIIELQKGTLAVNPEDACLHAHFNASSAEFITLLTSNFEPNRCPYLGKYDVVGLQQKASRKDMKTRDSCKDFTSVDAGCHRHDEIEFFSSCPNTQKTHKYQCHANWEEDGINYLITTQRGSKAKFCFMYIEMENGLKFSSSRETCSRKIQPGINGYMAFNITDKSDCISHETVKSIATTTTTTTTTTFVIPFLGLYHFITLLLVFQVR
uniref:Uncharacterized protein n=1 Tax=Strigamia maritima TaxID=126957 RepID=T1IZP1_STRMM